jgi:predicted O-linked N-acetylglucosamine transferase (SPINDLY family)
LRALGQPAAALAQYEQLLAAAPAHAEACFEHGSALQDLHRDAAALASFDRALAVRPDFAEAWVGRALALLALQRTEEALAAGERAIALAPGLPEAHFSCGLIFCALQRHAESLACYERALALRPAHAEAHGNRGHELEVLRRLPEALASYEQALLLDPRNPDYLYGRGAVLHLMERHAEAMACYDQALAIAPSHAGSLANRGNALLTLKRPVEAAAAYARLLAVAPDHPYALGNRLHAQLLACDWAGWDDVALIAARVANGKLAEMPFHMLAAHDSAALQQQCARLHAADAYPAAAPVWRGERYRHQRIRLAYVSGDLSFHPVSYLIAQLLETHDRRRFEVTAISLRPPAASAFDARIRGAFEHFVEAAALGDAQIARLMHERETDIAIDLMGYTNLPRLGVYANRPAPVQAAYLGYAGTLGTSYMDYLIADAAAIPPALARHYDEQLVHLPASFMPRDTTVQPTAGASRASAGLPERAFVFCCFNNAYKLNPPVFNVWMRVLRAVPDSVLWLTDPGEAPRANLLREAASRGVTPGRLVFAGKTARIEDHLGRVALADLFLDTLPYNAHTTASDALWAGVPLLTCTGAAFASRVAASLLTAAGLPELITSSLGDYEALAIALAQQPARLAAWRERLARQHSARTLFDPARLCRHLESAYLTMHERQQRGLPPAAFSVSA